MHNIIQMFVNIFSSTVCTAKWFIIFAEPSNKSRRKDGAQQKAIERSYLSDINPHILFCNNNNNDDDRNTQTTMIRKGNFYEAYEALSDSAGNNLRDDVQVSISTELG